MSVDGVHLIDLLADQGRVAQLAPRRVARVAPGVMPRAMLSSVSIARCASSSRARSSSQRPRRKKRVRTFRLRLQRLTQTSCRPQDPVDRPHDLVPAVGLRRELLACPPASGGSSARGGCSPTCPRTTRSSRDPRAGAAPDRASRARPAARPRSGARWRRRWCARAPAPIASVFRINRSSVPWSSSP